MPNRISGPGLPVRTGDISSLPAGGTPAVSAGNALPSVHDAFEPAAQASWAPKVKTALDALDGRVRTLLHHDALSLARGHTPVREGDPLTPEQQDALEEAAKDFFLDLCPSPRSARPRAGRWRRRCRGWTCAGGIPTRSRCGSCAGPVRTSPRRGRGSSGRRSRP
ncbi:MAG: hypothetical protein FJ086_10635, partial [Deltaproteobacteria bacterium]|nr:hypothetical protein [Deltaproteobacteria bacterium]